MDNGENDDKKEESSEVKNEDIPEPDDPVSSSVPEPEPEITVVVPETLEDKDVEDEEVEVGVEAITSVDLIEIEVTPKPDEDIQDPAAVIEVSGTGNGGGECSTGDDQTVDSPPVEQAVEVETKSSISDDKNEEPDDGKQEEDKDDKADQEPEPEPSTTTTTAAEETIVVSTSTPTSTSESMTTTATIEEASAVSTSESVGPSKAILEVETLPETRPLEEDDDDDDSSNFSSSDDGDEGPNATYVPTRSSSPEYQRQTLQEYLASRFGNAATGGSQSQKTEGDKDNPEDTFEGSALKISALEEMQLILKERLSRRQDDETLKLSKMSTEELSMIEDPAPEKTAGRQKQRNKVISIVAETKKREMVAFEIGDKLVRFLEGKYLKDQSIEDLRKNIAIEFSTPTAINQVISTLELIIRQTLFLESMIQKVAAIGLLIKMLHDAKDPVQTKLISVVNELVNVEDYTEKFYEEFLTSKPEIELNALEKSVISKLKDADPLSTIWEENILDLIESDPRFEELPDEVQDEFYEEAEEDIPDPDPEDEYFIPEPTDIDKVMTDLYVKPYPTAVFQMNDDESVDENERKLLDWFLEDPDAFLHLPRTNRSLIGSDEVAWLSPSNDGAHQLEILRKMDPKMVSEGTIIRIKEMVKPALIEALSITQRQKLLEELKCGPVNPVDIGITPEVIPQLVENNPVVAIEILSKTKDDGRSIEEFLAKITEMDMSVHSMEVVNRLTSSVKLPDEFLYKYVSNCVKTCEGMQDKFVQSRLVRLLCVFLQSLIRNQLFDFQILYIEILSFCITFSRIREAAALYRLMKQVEGEDPELKEMLSGKLENHQHLSEEAARYFSIKDKDAKP